MKHFLLSICISLVLLLAITNFLPCSGQSHNDYFLNGKETAGAAESGNYLGQTEYHGCFITVKEIKKIGGQCMKIRDKIQACVAGNMMQLMHHDCI